MEQNTGTGTVEVTAELLNEIATTLEGLRNPSAETVKEALAEGGFSVVAMSASGKLKKEAATRWHLRGADAGFDVWGIGYKVENHRSAYQERGAICGYERSLEAAEATVAKITESKCNGRQNVVAGSVHAMPAYLMRDTDEEVVTKALRVAYEAWIDAEAEFEIAAAKKRAAAARRAAAKAAKK